MLDGHQRQKQKLIPPLMRMPQFEFVSTLEEVFPEIVWIGLNLERHGLRNGIEIVSSFMEELWKRDHDRNDWYRFSTISANEKTLESVERDVLKTVSESFHCLALVYDWSGLSWAETDIAKEDAAAKVEAAVRKYADRFEQPYLLALSTVIYGMARADKVKFAPGTLPNFEAIATNWGSDESKMAAAQARAMSMAFFPSDTSAGAVNWSKTFWRTNYLISKCEPQK
ncbi:MAG: hypothetical protein HKN36_13535 [Hellea sp.]|nr:hypothetical protein [Hellea sp.]